jgi:tartrate dehydrogenase/decarboxylase/D-malate dehydrogenase
MAGHTAYTIDVIAGDGIGREVMPAAIACVDALARAFDFSIQWRHRDWGSDHYRRYGRMMPVDGIEQLATGDAILLGAVGAEDIPDDVTLWGLLIPIRREFDQYVNLRPIPGAPRRHLTAGRRRSPRPGGRPRERRGRVLRDRWPRVSRSPRRVRHPGGGLHANRSPARRRIRRRAGHRAHWPPHLGDQVQRDRPHHALLGRGVEDVAARTPELVLEKVLIDALAARLVLKPHSVDVIVASNLFGDILSDLAAAVAGSIGVAPSANLNPPRRHPSMFEPVHGSAPDIAGQGMANPVGQMWAAAMMLDHLDQPAAASALVESFESALAAGVRTRDLGGTASTTEFAGAVLRNWSRVAESSQG